MPLLDELDDGRRGAPRSSSTCPTSRCSARAERLLLASRVLAAGCATTARTSASSRRASSRFALPSLAVIGTGQARREDGRHRIRGAAARTRPRRRRRLDGPGRPAEPEVAEVAADARDLFELSRAGRHAASDYLETAALTGVATIGCRRCGGGLAGAVVDLERARRRGPGGRARARTSSSSTAAAPRSRRSRRCARSWSSHGHDPTGYLNPYRRPDLATWSFCSAAATSRRSAR